MGLGEWDTTLKLVPGFREGESESDQIHSWAITDTSWFYQFIKITLFKYALDRKKCDPYQLEDTVVHELVHSLVEPVTSNKTQNDRDRCEFVVVNLTRAFLKMKYGDALDEYQQSDSPSYNGPVDDGPVQQVEDGDNFREDPQVYH